MHALELAGELKLTPGQRDALRTVMDEHKAEAPAIGERLVEAERVLDRLFRSGKVGASELKAKVDAAGALRADYRLAHLDAHRRTRGLLTPEQVREYDRLRGYADGRPHHK
jgi:Spy/CpxP family protein refolding chaperone